MKRLTLVSVILLIMLSGNSLNGSSNTNTNTNVEYPRIGVEVKGECNDLICGEGYNIDGTTYVPIRLVMEAMGATVTWNRDANSVSILPNVSDDRDKVSNNQNSSEADKEMEKEIKKFELRMESEIEKLELFDEQISNGYQLYELDKEKHWILQLSKVKLDTRRKSSAKLTEDIISYQLKYELSHQDVSVLTELSKKINEVNSYYGLTLLALENHINHNSTADYKNYLIQRNSALDILASLKELILNLKIQNVEDFG